MCFKKWNHRTSQCPDANPIHKSGSLSTNGTCRNRWAPSQQMTETNLYTVLFLWNIQYIKRKWIGRR